MPIKVEFEPTPMPAEAPDGVQHIDVIDQSRAEQVTVNVAAQPAGRVVLANFEAGDN